jgi:hypothetical protein
LIAAARSAGDAEDVSMITGTPLSQGWLWTLAQHGVAIVLEKVNVQHDQMGPPDWPIHVARYATQEGDGFLTVGGHHHIAWQLATVQGFAKQ